MGHDPTATVRGSHATMYRPEDVQGDHALIKAGATSGPGTALNAPGGLVAFARGADNAIWHAWQEHPNGNWW